MSEKTELLPCPFCGSKNLSRHDFYNMSWVECDACEASGPIGDKDGVELTWNTRIDRK